MVLLVGGKGSGNGWDSDSVGWGTRVLNAVVREIK